jgi:hypothetical protein
MNITPVHEIFHTWQDFFFYKIFMKKVYKIFYYVLFILFFKIITVPRAKIVGPSNIQVPKGSTISLTCSVDLQASLILWWAINYVKTNCLSHSRFLLHFFALSPFFVTFASYKILLSSFYSFLPSSHLVYAKGITIPLLSIIQEEGLTWKTKRVTREWQVAYC